VSRDARRRYLVAYDVADDRRRIRLAKRLAGYGDRIQYSVFVVDARPAKLVRLKAAIVRLIDLGTDSVLICDLGPEAAVHDGRFQIIGLSRPITDESSIIL